MKEDYDFKCVFIGLGFFLVFIAVCLMIKANAENNEQEKARREHERQVNIAKINEDIHRSALKRELEDIELKRDYLVEMCGWTYSQVRKYTNLSDRRDAIKQELKY